MRGSDGRSAPVPRGSQESGREPLPAVRVPYSARLHAVRACSVGGAPTAAVELAHQRGKDQDTIAAPAASITSDEWAEGHE